MFWTVAIRRVEREREWQRIESGQQKERLIRVHTGERDKVRLCARMPVFVWVSEWVKEREMVDNHDMCCTLSATSTTLISCPPYHSITPPRSDLRICFSDLFFFYSAFPHVCVKYSPDKSSLLSSLHFIPGSRLFVRTFALCWQAPVHVNKVNVLNTVAWLEMEIIKRIRQMSAFILANVNNAWMLYYLKYVI